VHVANYAYDEKGRRTAKTTYSGGTVTTKYVYDGDNLIAEYNGSTLLRKYVYGPRIDEPICMVTSGGTQYFYYFDGLGSVVRITDSSGIVQDTYTYDVFGQPSAASTVNNRFMFTGREYDSETGNYYYRARYYKPSIGRFLQPDPIGYMDSINLYTYCENNPVNTIDPSGQCGSYSFSSVGKVLSVTLVDKKFLGCLFITKNAVAAALEKAMNRNYNSKSGCGKCEICLILYRHNSTTPFLIPFSISLSGKGDIVSPDEAACIAYVFVAGIVTINIETGICVPE
jgi:RHS repeat-associated protein